ncbi:uncharacterized protein LOC118434770 isoform X2 [Folsomia candida]|nr:uncharacterized protein LOC118434770 isoform X2 [Folsomia candida]
MHANNINVQFFRPPKIPASGTYPIFMYEVVQVDQELDHQFKTSIRPDNFPQLRQQPALCLSLDHKTYFYQPTKTHDLWSLLSEILFHKLIYASQIYDIAMRIKVDELNYYHYSKWKKRLLTKGHAQSEKLRQQYKRSSKVITRHRGDTQDIQRVSDAIGLSYTLIGLDANGNFFWKECIKPEQPVEEGLQKISLFVRLLKNRQPVWYCMDDSEVDVVKEAEVYGNSTFTDTTTLQREMYFKQHRIEEEEGLGLISNVVVPSSASRFKSLLSGIFTGGKSGDPPSFMRQPVSDTMAAILGRASEFVARLIRRNTRVEPEELSAQQKEKQISSGEHP